MTVIDEFIIKFKSDAGTTTADVKKLDDEISKLAAKGQKRNDEETKQLKELRKLRTDTVQDVKDQTEATDLLTESLIGLGISAVAAFAGFEAIKKVTTDAYDLNLNLQKTRALTGQNAEEIQAWDQAFERFGAPGGQFTEWFTAYSQYLQKTGQDTKQILPFLRALSDELHSLPEDQARQRFQQAAQAFGLPQEFYIALRNGGQALDDLIAKQAGFIKSSKQSEDAARGLASAWGNAWSAIVGLATSIETKLIPSLTNLGNILAALLSGHFKEAFDLWRFTGLAPQGNAPSGTAGAPSSGPLGIRSNNPGNLQPGGREAIFPSLQAGISAEQAQLKKYGARGINTLAGIAANWPDKAHQASWLAAVARYTGLDPNQPLDLNNPLTQAKVAQGINYAEGDVAANAAFAGKTAIAQADQSNFNLPGAAGGSNSLSIGSLTVQTQARDAPGIADAIVDELNRAYRATIGNWDDGVVK